VDSDSGLNSTFIAADGTDVVTLVGFTGTLTQDDFVHLLA
jgi:hypothetical protein